MLGRAASLQGTGCMGAGSVGGQGWPSWRRQGNAAPGDARERLRNIHRDPDPPNMRVPAPQALQALPAAAQLLGCRSLQPSLLCRPSPWACPAHRAHPAPQGVLAAERQRQRARRLAAAAAHEQQQQDDWNIGLSGGRQAGWKGYEGRAGQGRAGQGGSRRGREGRSEVVKGAQVTADQVAAPAEVHCALAVVLIAGSSTSGRTSTWCWCTLKSRRTQARPAAVAWVWCGSPLAQWRRGQCFGGSAHPLLCGCLLVLQATWPARARRPMWACTWLGRWALSWTARSERERHSSRKCSLRWPAAAAAGCAAAGTAGPAAHSFWMPALVPSRCCRLKRAGLDYWAAVCVDVHPSWGAFYAYWQQQPGPKQLVGEGSQGRGQGRTLIALVLRQEGSCVAAGRGRGGPCPSRRTFARRRSCLLTPSLRCFVTVQCRLFAAGYSKFAKHHHAAEGLYPAGASTWLMFGAEVGRQQCGGCCLVLRVAGRRLAHRKRMTGRRQRMPGGGTAARGSLPAAALP